MVHVDPHPMAGRAVGIRLRAADPMVGEGVRVARLEDWFDRVHGSSWRSCGVIAATMYAVRVIDGLGREAALEVLDDEVAYVKIDGLGYLVHETELDYANA